MPSHQTRHHNESSSPLSAAARPSNTTGCRCHSTEVAQPTITSSSTYLERSKGDRCHLRLLLSVTDVVPISTIQDILYNFTKQRHRRLLHKVIITSSPSESVRCLLNFYSLFLSSRTYAAEVLGAERGEMLLLLLLI